MSNSNNASSYTGNSFREKLEGQMLDENNRLLEAQRAFVKEHGIDAFTKILDFTANKEEFKTYNTYVRARTELVHGRSAKG